METCQSKGTRWAITGRVLRVESGTAISLSYLLSGEEFNREILTVGDIVSNADSVLCLTECSFSQVTGEYNISSRQHFNLSRLDTMREEKLVSTRIKEFFKHLIEQYSPEKICHLDWVPLPFTLTQSQIAGFSSTTRVTVTRALDELINAGFVKREKRRIFINIDAFKE